MLHYPENLIFIWNLDTPLRSGPGLNSRPLEPYLLAARDQHARPLGHLRQDKKILLLMAWNSRSADLHGH
jgi:hypothetical protein